MPSADRTVSDLGAASQADATLLHPKLFAPYKIAVLVDAAAEHGIDPSMVLAGTGLKPALVHDPHTRTSVHDYLRALENIVAAGGGLGLALDVGSRLHLSAYGMYGYALMCSPTMRDFFDFAVRYHLLATPMLGLEWRCEGDLAVWRFAEIYQGLMSLRARSFLAHQQMAMTATHVRDISGEDVTPIRALFALPASGGLEAERRLGCPCLFDQAAHELHYPIRLLDRAPHFGNRLTHAWLQETCEELLGQTRRGSGIVAEIYQRLVAAALPPASMQALAKEFGVTERTLRRHLQREGARYADIVDDVRRTVSLRYLQATRMTADDIAAKVGFSDTANLRRAIKRWTGRTFAEVRRDGPIEGRAAHGAARR